MDDEPNGADVAIKIAGQEFNLRNVKSLNTLATVSTLIVACLIAYVLYVHNADAKDSGKEIAAELKASNKEVAIVLRDNNRELSEVLKGLAQATREQNCLLGSGITTMPLEKRRETSDFCKSISR